MDKMVFGDKVEDFDGCRSKEEGSAGIHRGVII